MCISAVSAEVGSQIKALYCQISESDIAGLDSRLASALLFSQLSYLTISTFSPR